MKRFMYDVANILICPRRINRTTYLIRVLLWCVVVPCVTVQAVKVGSILFGVQLEFISMIGVWLALIGYLSATISRLHDCNHSAWFVIVAIFPIAVFVLAISSGTKGSNKFGNAPESGFNIKNTSIAQTV